MKSSILATCAVITALVAFASGAATQAPCHLYSSTLESPCFNLVKEGNGYEIREYGAQKQFWSVASIHTDSFDQAAKDGFMRNFKFISGANSKKEKISMTAPVLMAHVDGRTHNESYYTLSFFMPSTLGDDVPTADQDLNVNVVLGAPDVKVAVIKFGGYAIESDVMKYSAELKALLQKDGIEIVQGVSPLLAIYNSPFHILDRHNEVLVFVK